MEGVGGVFLARKGDDYGGWWRGMDEWVDVLFE
jgi:hypothetical protein